FLALDPNGPLIGPVQQTKQVEEGRLPRAAGPLQSHELPGRESQRNLPKGGDARSPKPVGPREPASLDEQSPPVRAHSRSHQAAASLPTAAVPGFAPNGAAEAAKILLFHPKLRRIRKVCRGARTASCRLRLRPTSNDPSPMSNDYCPIERQFFVCFNTSIEQISSTSPLHRAEPI